MANLPIVLALDDDTGDTLTLDDSSGDELSLGIIASTVSPTQQPAASTSQSPVGSTAPVVLLGT